MTALVSQNPSVQSIFTFNSGLVEPVEVRTVFINGEPWFVLRDVLLSIGSSSRPKDIKDSIINLLGDGVVKDYPFTDQRGRTQNSIIIAKPAATTIISRSNTEIGRRANRWIHVEVLPKLEKHGFYGDPALIQKLQEEALFYRHKINYLSPEKIHTSTYIGDKLGMSNQKFLALTSDMGLTIKDRRSYGNAWRLTKSGGIYGKYSGAYIKWSERVLIPAYKRLGMDEKFFTEAITYIESRQTSLIA